MKKQFLSVLTMLSLAAAVVAALTVKPASAQVFDTVEVDVPFVFSSGSQEFPAGKYTIEAVNDGGAILIRSEDHNATGTLICFSAQTLSPKKETSVVFNRYGDHYFLSQVWTAGETIGIELAKSPIERRFQQNDQAGTGASARASGSAKVTVAATMGAAK